MADPYETQLLARADRALAGRPVEEAVGKIRAIIGVPQVPDSEKAAQAALDKLRSNEAPTAAELAALEFVIRMMRPAPLSRSGRLDALPSAPGSSLYNPVIADRWDRFRDLAAPLLYSVGRLDRATGADTSVGTGFLVADELLLTNRHVVDSLSHGTGILEEGQAVVRFQQEYGSPDTSPPVPVTGVTGVHETLDMALLAVRLATPRVTLPLDRSAPTSGSTVAAVGYPMADPSSPLFADAIYQNKYNVKRAALGELLAAESHRLLHDCSTLGGSSGSPLFSLESGGVIGLHYSGMFMYRNEAIPAKDISTFIDGA